MTNTGLDNLDIKKIQSVFNLHPEIEKAILFGSRAKGNYKAASDIDLTLVGNSLTLTIQQEIEHELDDLLLPYKFDISIYHTINSTELVNHINRVGQLFFQKEKAGN
ncbi:nucleotidyltransferase domain-containing protein [Flavobacterium sp. ST-87]|uniref:Nucleotidyltransferase domain-containing protein n=1 Tax=Flavobacterium plantiphilum TaxID=3163297 RepID=A0ABW8XT05_9FLAO